MTIKEFIQRTKNMPEDTEMFIGERLTDFKYGLVNSVTLEEINMTEEPDGSGEKATEWVVLLEED